MTVTEQQAADKWCSMVRASAGGEDNNACNAGTGIRTGGRNPILARCIGSECMSWRWKDQHIYGKYVLADAPEATKEPDRSANGIPETWVWQPFDGEDEACWIEPEEETLARRTGYCGLAGKPTTP